jgi:VIT1/CCC1 family predicted Fe2+/Mn2+ transporter
MEKIMNTNAKNLSPEAFKLVLQMQLGEITESEIYARLAKRIKEVENKKIISKIAADEHRHSTILELYTGIKMKPNMNKVRWYLLLDRLFGFTFAIRLMENGEGLAQKSYEILLKEVPEALQIQKDEEIHEGELVDMLDEDRLKFVGSMVLGMNDALVELTGALAGLTLAYQDLKNIVLSGLVVGVAASFSMAASDYLSARAEGDKMAAKSAIYTGVTYLFTVLLMVLPYLLFLGTTNPGVDKWIALAIMLSTVIVIIAVFNFYLSVAKKFDFKARFLEMAIISLGVAGLSFLFSYVLKITLGIEA